MNKEPIHLTSHHKSFDDAVDYGIMLEDDERGHNSFILLSPKTSNDKFSKCIIGTTKGVLRRSNSNNWSLIWTYGK